MLFEKFKSKMICVFKITMLRWLCEVFKVLRYKMIGGSVQVQYLYTKNNIRTFFENKSVEFNYINKKELCL